MSFYSPNAWCIPGVAMATINMPCLIFIYTLSRCTVHFLYAPIGIWIWKPGWYVTDFSLLNYVQINFIMQDVKKVWDTY